MHVVAGKTEHSGQMICCYKPQNDVLCCQNATDENLQTRQNRI